MKQLPTAASLLLTENCNLRCTYCFEKHNKAMMPKEVGRKAIDWLSDNALKTGTGEFSVLLFGGEPLLNIDTIEEVLEYGVKIAKEKDLYFTASMVTNATVMNERIYNVLRKFRDEVNLGIQLSVDGIPEVQDKYRLTVAGKGSWNMVEKNLPKFKALYDNNPDDGRLSIHGCINKETMPYLYENYNFFRKVLGFKRIWFLPIAEEHWDANDVALYRENSQKIFNDCVEDMLQSMDYQDALNYAPFDRFTGLQCRAEAPCGAGRSFVTITANGEIYPCHQIYFNDPEKDTLLGNIMKDGELDEDRRRMFLEYEEEDIGCQDCKNTQCFRCLATNYVNNGGVLSQIRGLYCALSSIDRYFQGKMLEVVQKLHLAPPQEEEEIDCLCNARSATSARECDIVNNKDLCQSGNNPSMPGCLCDVDYGLQNKLV